MDEEEVRDSKRDESTEAGDILHKDVKSAWPRANGSSDALQQRRECESCKVKSEQIAKILKILSQTLVFLAEAKKWKRDTSAHYG